jgi:hypothetical protein
MPPTDPPDWKPTPGTRVIRRDGKWGEGTVLDVTPRHARVCFDLHGETWIALAYLRALPAGTAHCHRGACGHAPIVGAVWLQAEWLRGLGVRPLCESCARHALRFVIPDGFAIYAPDGTRHPSRAPEREHDV